MLQEVYNVPSIVNDDYDVAHVKGRFFSGNEAKYGTALLARKPDWSIGSEVTWRSEHDWVNRIQETFPGWLVGRQILHKSGDHHEVVSVYIPAYPVHPYQSRHGPSPELCKILKGVDLSPILLRHKSDLWFHGDPVVAPAGCQNRGSELDRRGRLQQFEVDRQRRDRQAQNCQAQRPRPSRLRGRAPRRVRAHLGQKSANTVADPSARLRLCECADVRSAA